MSLLQEFRVFAMRGNVVDLAVGVIIGAAFGLLVKSMVDDILMPPIGYLMGGLDFSEYAYTLRPATETTKAVTINFGKFINAVIGFIIQAASIFVLIKTMNSVTKRFQQEKAAEPTAKPADVLVLEEIRDLLARGR